MHQHRHQKLRVWIGVLALMGGTLSESRAHADANANANANAGADAATDADADSAGAISACQRTLSDLRPSLQKGTRKARIRHALLSLATDCVPLSPELRSAARNAAEARTTTGRLEILFRASGRTDRCAPRSAAASVATIAAERCPPPEALALSSALLRDLDAGTYLFALTVAEVLSDHALIEPDGKFFLLELLLASALDHRAQEGTRR